MTENTDTVTTGWGFQMAGLSHFQLFWLGINAARKASDLPEMLFAEAHDLWLRTKVRPRFSNVSCSQCGKEFGPGDHGYSSCQNHKAGAQ